jgi:hypothetical protein
MSELGDGGRGKSTGIGRKWEARDRWPEVQDTRSPMELVFNVSAVTKPKAIRPSSYRYVVGDKFAAICHSRAR